MGALWNTTQVEASWKRANRICIDDWLWHLFIADKWRIYFLSSHKLLEQMEGKNSTLKEDIVTLKEALNKATLEKEVLEQEKAEISKLFTNLRGII